MDMKIKIVEKKSIAKRILKFVKWLLITIGVIFFLFSAVYFFLVYREYTFFAERFDIICEEITNAGIPLNYKFTDITYRMHQNNILAYPINEDGNASVKVIDNGNVIYMVKNSKINKEKQKELLQNIIKRIYHKEIIIDIQKIIDEQEGLQILQDNFKRKGYTFFYIKQIQKNP